MSILIIFAALKSKYMNFDIVFVLLALIGMIAALVWDKMRPGMVLLTVVVFFLCVGILTPQGDAGGL